MDLNVEKIKGFSNWMDRKPRAWLLFVLSSGVVFFANGWLQTGRQLKKCQEEKTKSQDETAQALQKANDTYFNLLQMFMSLKQAQQKQADSVQNLKEKAKSVIQEVKKKL